MIAAAATAMVGCSKTDKGAGVVRHTPREICISSSVSDLSVVSKTAYNNDDPLKSILFMRVDATEKPTSFIGAGVFWGDRVNEATNITFRQAEYYDDKTNKNTYLFGYYPEPDNMSSTLEWEIDGKKDVLLTDIYDAGTQDNPLIPVMHFKHLLTQFEVICVTQTGKTDEVRERWGKITSIKMQFPRSSIILDHDKMIVSPGAQRNEQPFFVQADYTTDFQAVDIQDDTNTTTTAAGMFLPDTFYGITLLVKTEKKAERAAKINFGPGNIEAGKRYVTTLIFNLNSIDVKTTIDDWSAGTSHTIVVE